MTTITQSKTTREDRIIERAIKDLPNGEYLSIDTTAKILGVSSRQVHRYICGEFCTNPLPAFRLNDGGKYKIRAIDLKNFRRQQESNAYLNDRFNEAPNVNYTFNRSTNQSIHTFENGIELVTDIDVETCILKCQNKVIKKFSIKRMPIKKYTQMIYFYSLSYR